ncbi:MAG: ABC transporter permease, partial [Chloroflexi bacterium]|nr:ABC transporter permease [Chloroflexota bacterium]
DRCERPSICARDSNPMKLIVCIATALDNLRANKMRSALTMLGVIIGVSAVILMVGIIQGASSRVTSEFQKLGSNLIIVFYGPNSEERKAANRRIDGMTMDDVAAIREKCDKVKIISPALPLGSGNSARFGANTIDVTTTGVQPEYTDLRNEPVSSGRFISGEDIATWAKVCVIGDKVRDELFHHADPIGQDIEVGGLSLTVVGVLAVKGQTFDGDADKQIFLPLTTVQKRYLGNEQVGVIWAEPTSLSDMNAAKDQIWQLLMQRYHNLPGFRVDSLDNMLNSVNQVLAIFTVVLGSIAGLALLVGGIGIMNIMLVSVTERTREIGLRKAVGAKRKDILLQFLVESATVSGAGGLIGVAMGTGGAYGIGYVTRFIPQLVDPQSGARGMAIFVPPLFCAGAFAFSALVGIFFGVYPALRASGLDPVTALRHE